MFGALPPECLELLLQEGRLWQMEKGDWFFKQGDESGKFCIILSGFIRFYQPRERDGKMMPLRLYGVGEQIGFVGMIGLHERRGDALMEQEGFILEISSDLFHELCLQLPQAFQIFLINIAREMSREISQLDQMCTVESPPIIID